MNGGDPHGGARGDVAEARASWAQQHRHTGAEPVGLQAEVAASSINTIASDDQHGGGHDPDVAEPPRAVRWRFGDVGLDAAHNDGIVWATSRGLVWWSCTDALLTTRAMRRYADEPVTDEEVLHCLQAAQQAPSGGNLQPRQYLVVPDPSP